MNKVVLYCRPGFEKECAAEITDKAAKRASALPRKRNAGYVVFECYQPEDADKLARELLVQLADFARQMFVAGELLKDLPRKTASRQLWACCRAWWRGRRSAR